MRVNLEDLRTDMVLAADVVDGGGRLLLPSGTALTEKHLRYCQMWGVAGAEVVGAGTPEGAGEPPLDPVLVAKIEAATAIRFTHADRDHPAIAALFEHCVKIQLKKGG